MTSALCNYLEYWFVEKYLPVYSTGNMAVQKGGFTGLYRMKRNGTIKRKSAARCRAVLLGFFLLAGGRGYGGELFVGAGYGEQVGLVGFDQDNTVVDVLYDFYEINRQDFRLSLGAGVSRLWNDFDDETVMIGSLLPTLRFFFGESTRFKPYAFVSTGFSYMTEPGLGHQLLGGYFAFNDFFGVASYVGRERVWSASICWRHISNAGLFEPNAGIDLPLCLLVGRRF